MARLNKELSDLEPVAEVLQQLQAKRQEVGGQTSRTTAWRSALQLPTFFTVPNIWFRLRRQLLSPAPVCLLRLPLTAAAGWPGGAGRG